ncbi:MAG: nucleotidyl transferase AbiEii/AbiGii toxin family protein [Nitrospirae bacterium]|nr:nucleotidyl transferase AbiEii/AbiGii toxin family protein [Nitrospirota bacterium]
MTIHIHKECLSDAGWKVLRSLKDIIKKYHGTMAGGTALALQIGHRISGNLDFYTDICFSMESLIADIRRTGRPFNIISEEDGYLFAEVDGVRFSLLEYDYPFIQETLSVEGIRVAGVLDIVTMKLMAVSQNGTKGDFADIYFVLKDTPFTDVAWHMVKRFGKERVNAIDIGRSLVDFSGADFNPEPVYMKGHKVSWDEVKVLFKRESKQFSSDLERVLVSGK